MLCVKSWLPSNTRTHQRLVITRSALEGGMQRCMERRGNFFSQPSSTPQGCPSHPPLSRVCGIHPPPTIHTHHRHHHQALYSLWGIESLFLDLCVPILIWKLLVSRDILAVNTVAIWCQSNLNDLPVWSSHPLPFLTTFLWPQQFPSTTTIPTSPTDTLDNAKPLATFENDPVTSIWPARHLNKCWAHSDMDLKCPLSLPGGREQWTVPVCCWYPIRAVLLPCFTCQGPKHALSQWVPELLLFLKW